MPKFHDWLIDAVLEVVAKTSKTVASKGLFFFDTATGVPVYSDGTSFRPFGGASSSVGQTDWALLANSPTEAPIDDVNYPGIRLLEFNNEQAQDIWTSISVPADYVAGTQINLLGGKITSELTTGKALFKAESYLVKTGSAVISDRSKAWTSLNAEVSISSIANTLTALGDIDLTSSTGKVKNSADDDVAVVAGDLLIVKLSRVVQSESSSAPGIVRLLRDSFSVKFTP